MLGVRDIHGWQLETYDNCRAAGLAAVYVDDKQWRVIYAAARLHAHSEILIPAPLLGSPNFKERLFPVHLSRADLEEKLRALPALTLVLSSPEKPQAPSWRRYVSEAQAAAPYSAACPRPAAEHIDFKARRDNRRLHSSAELIGCRVVTADGGEGRLDDMLLDLVQWRILYVIVALSRGLRWKRLLLRPNLIEKIETRSRRIFLSSDRAALEAAPSLDWEQSPLTH